jgi:uncharacterized protein
MAQLLSHDNRLRMLSVSPLDDVDAACAAPAVPMPEPTRRWRASRFNARSVTSDGGTVIWNTLTGAINYFTGAQAVQVAELLRKQGVAGDLPPLGEYLQTRGYLVPADVNEYRTVQLAFGEQQYRSDILELILLASEDCNFRCTYCYESFSRGTMQASVRTGIKRLVARRATELRRLLIGWFGGEPLYGFDAIEDLAPYLLQVARDHGIAFGSHITTNGYLLDDEKVEKLLSWNINQFQITIDGTADQHNARRPARDGTPTFDTILSNLQRMRASRHEFHVALRVNYDLENLDAIETFLGDLEREFGGDARFVLAFHPVAPLGGPNDAALPVCGLADVKQADRRFHAAAAAHNLHFNTLRGASGLGSHVCYAARPYNFIVGAAGTLMKCTVTLDHQPENIVGRITEDGELVLDRNHLALWVEPAFAHDSACQACYLLPSCQGMHCPLVRIQDNRTPCPSTKSDLRGALEATLMQPAAGHAVSAVAPRD